MHLTTEFAVLFWQVAIAVLVVLLLWASWRLVSSTLAGEHPDRLVVRHGVVILLRLAVDFDDGHHLDFYRDAYLGFPPGTLLIRGKSLPESPDQLDTGIRQLFNANRTDLADIQKEVSGNVVVGSIQRLRRSGQGPTFEVTLVYSQYDVARSRNPVQVDKSYETFPNLVSEFMGTNWVRSLSA